MNSFREDKADPILYRLYFSIVCEDILHKLGFDASQENKRILHEFHKRVLEYKSIANESQDVVSHFLFLVGVYWSQHGIFVRTKIDQPMELPEIPLQDCWEWL